MTQVIIPPTSIERIYPTENDVGNDSYNGIRGTEQNISRQVGSSMFNGILSNVDGNGINLGVGGFELIAYSPTSLVVTFNLGRAHINGYFINCIAANTVDLTLDSDKRLFVYLKLVKASGIVNDSGDPYGALKIVASETPVNLFDYIPLYIIETDANGVIRYESDTHFNQVLDMREHALREQLHRFSANSIVFDAFFERPSWSAGCVVSGMAAGVKNGGVSDSRYDEIYTRIHNGYNADNVDSSQVMNWWHAPGGPAGVIFSAYSILRSPLCPTSMFPYLANFTKMFAMKSASDSFYNAPISPYLRDQWIISDW